MLDYEKDLLDEMLRYGTILSDKEFQCEGKFVRHYQIEYEGERYNLSKMNGEWIYLHHIIGK